jgi:hypothetical protein
VLKDYIDDNQVRYVASAPPDYRYSFSGSALPFANPSQAFQNTPNKGLVYVTGNAIQLKLLYPNSYYIGLGTLLIPPMVSLHYKSHGEEKVINIQIQDQVPYRLLNYPKARINSTFYRGTECLPTRTQEQILRDSAYPKKNTTPLNHWGLKPRC